MYEYDSMYAAMHNKENKSTISGSYVSKLIENHEYIFPRYGYAFSYASHLTVY